jgi:diguanylate cyclase (GGDEF)-like protein
MRERLLPPGSRAMLAHPSLLVSLTVAAAAVARIVVLQARVRALRADAVTDPLTGAFNRRQMHVALSAAVERSRRSGEPASILLIDVDRFKDVNDAFGHAEGDRALKALVGLVGGRFRRLDAVFRAGGDEFVVLLAGARVAGAFGVADELRTIVHGAAPLPHWPLSISVGVAELAPEHSVEAWLQEADDALYRAKRAGRNRVAGCSADAREASSRLHVPLRIS